MESCMMKPEVKKKPKPPKPPPKPVEVRRNHPEKPTPAVLHRPTDADNEDVTQGQTKEKRRETPVVPPRRTEKEMNGRHNQLKKPSADDTKTARGSDPSAARKDEPDFRKTSQSASTAIFQRSQKEKTPSFTSYVSADRDDKEKPDRPPAKQTPTRKPGGLKGVMKSLNFKSSPQAVTEPGPDPSGDEALSENQPSAEKPKQEKNAESKQDLGDLFTGMFKKTPRDSSSSPAVKGGKADSDSEEDDRGDERAGEEKSHEKEEKGGFFHAMLKKSHKPAEETPEHPEDGVPESAKEKGGIFNAMFKKKPSEGSQPRPEEDRHSLSGDLSDSNDDPSQKEKGGFFSAILRKSPKIPVETTAKETDTAGGQENLTDDPKENLSAQKELSGSSDSLSDGTRKKEKGGVFAGMFKKSSKQLEGPQNEEGEELLSRELSASSDSLSENKEKGGLFSGLLRKTPKAPEENLSEKKDLSASSDSLPDAVKKKEKGGAFGGMFRKSPRPEETSEHEEGKQSKEEDPSAGDEGVSEEIKEKGGLFSGIFKKAPKPAAESDEDEELSASSEDLSHNIQEKAGFFGVTLKPVPRAPGAEERKLSPAFQEAEAPREESSSGEDLSKSDASKDKNIFSYVFKKPQKPAGKELETNPDKVASSSCENLSDAVPKEKKAGLAGIFKRSASIDNLFDEEKGGLFSGFLKKTPKASGEEETAMLKVAQRELTASSDSLSENSNAKDKSFFSNMFKKSKAAEGEEEANAGEDQKLSGSCENLLVENAPKEKSGGLAGMFRRSPKPAPRSIVTKDPLSDAKEMSGSCDSLADSDQDRFPGDEISASNENLTEAAKTPKDKKAGFAGMFKRTPRTSDQENEELRPLDGGGLRRRRTIKRKKRVVSFRVKTTLPRMPTLTLSSQASEELPLIEESLELQEVPPEQEDSVEVQRVEMAAYPAEGNPLETDEESDGLLEWWKTVEGWEEWNEASNFQEEDEEMALEQAADRVYMAARLFVRLFNQHGASLQQRILELLALADAADQFHKKTVSAAVGGGVASVVGSVTTITGLVLAPFTFGASIIVTAVGISVATAGSITSATANITDTVHSNMDRKKVEKMIQEYQDHIKDIRECLEFVQEGMDTLQEWDFEKYSQSAARKALNHNIKHVMKEGGRAGKALMINTDKLISTVQVLGVAGGAAKAAQAISVTTGVMSALFLALDVFFLAKDSHKLRKGAKTKFAAKIREVCKDLQDGLLELNKVKAQLQKTMDGIELEEFEEIQEVEEEVDDEFESDPKKLAELEQELDLLEEKLDQKVKEEKQMKDAEKETEEKQKSVKEKEDPDKTGEGDSGAKVESKENIRGEETDEAPQPAKDGVKEKPPPGSKKDKEAENRITAGKEKARTKREKVKEETEKKELLKEQEKVKGRSGAPERDDTAGKTNPERETSERAQNQREGRKTSGATVEKKEGESGSDRASKHERREDRKDGGGRNLDGVSRKDSKVTESGRGKDGKEEGTPRRESSRSEDQGSSRKEDQGSSRSGDKGSSRRGDKESFRSGDQGSSRNGDQGSSRRGDQGSSRGGDKESFRSGDKESFRSGDQGSSRNGDQGSSRRGDKETSRKEDQGSSRSGDHGSSRSGDQGSSWSGDKESSRKEDHGSSRSGDQGSSRRSHHDRTKADRGQERQAGRGGGDGESQRRDRERTGSHREHQHGRRSSVLREDGLYI